MAPKSKVSETGDIGHGVTFEVRPAKAGKPTVHVVIDGSRLPAFRLKDGSSATEQVRRLQQVDDHLARLTSGAPIDAGQPSGSDEQPARTAMESSTCQFRAAVNAILLPFSCRVLALERIDAMVSAVIFSSFETF